MYACKQTVVNNIILFLSYEKSKDLLKNYLTNKTYIYTISSIISTILSTTLTFPYEYFKTLSYAEEGICKKKGF
jgi:solute carrier family 25 protein 39/40